MLPILAMLLSKVGNKNNGKSELAPIVSKNNRIELSA